MKLMWKLAIAIPSAMIVGSGATIGVLAATGVLFNHTKTSIATIFTAGGNPYEWSNSASTPEGTSIENTSNMGSSTKPFEDVNKPSEIEIKTNLSNYLGRASKDKSIINDLIIGSYVHNDEKSWRINVTAQSDSQYDGTFQINIYINPVRDLATAIEKHIINDDDYDDSSVDVLEKLKALNPELVNLDAVEIGYKYTGQNFVSFASNYVMSKDNLGQKTGGLGLWTEYNNIDSKTNYAYKLFIHPLAGGWYAGSEDVAVYLSLPRISYDDDFFGTTQDRTLSNYGNVPFTVTPSDAQAKEAWIRKYQGTTTPFVYANFYSSSESNVKFEANPNNTLTLTYGNNNEFYTVGDQVDTTSTFGLEVSTPKDLSAVFVSDRSTNPISIQSDTATKQIEFYTAPTPADLAIVLSNTKAKLLERYKDTYGGDTWVNFQLTDFTSIRVSTISGTTSGTITLEPTNGSLLYTGSVQISWKLAQ